MSSKYKCKNIDGLYFITFTVRHWIDVFTRKEYKDILVENLAFCQNSKGLEIFAWVIMTNHLHLIARAKEGLQLQNIIGDYKKYTSKMIIKTISENQHKSRKEWLLKGFTIKYGHQFWQEGIHPIELWTGAVIDEKLEYIHQNPVKSGFVFRAEDYLYSSAADYAGEKGLLNISFV
jgi:REP element-mobilizing transposase RayT